LACAAALSAAARDPTSTAWRRRRLRSWTPAQAITAASDTKTISMMAIVVPYQASSSAYADLTGHA
jgi:hypothetical protein